MPISRELALQILKYLIDNPSFYFPFLVMCKGYASCANNDDNFVEIVPEDDYENLLESTHYDEFQLWENLQNLKTETLELMSKGFIEKIIGYSLEQKLDELAKEYRNKWSLEKCDSEDCEQFGENEYLGGKAEGFEEALNILRESLGKKHITLDE